MRLLIIKNNFEKIQKNLRLLFLSNSKFILSSYYPHANMKHQQHRVPTAKAIKIENKKSFFSMLLFIILFLGASYYAPEHIEGYNPPNQTTQAK